MSNKLKEKPPAIVPPVVVDPNQRYSVAESFAILRQSRAQIFRDIRDGKLAAIHEGKRTYIHGSELIRRARVAA